jgi:hypothetical protein
MTACDGYFPEPTISRDEKVLPAIINESEFMISLQSLSALST